MWLLRQAVMMSRLTTALLNDQDRNSGNKSWATCIVYIWERMGEEKVLPSELIPVSVNAGKIYALLCEVPQDLILFPFLFNNCIILLGNKVKYN